MMMLMSLLLATAMAGTESYTYDIELGGQRVGTRTVTVAQDDGVDASRKLTVQTGVAATVGPVAFQWRQRVTAFAGRDPASFHSVIDENGTPREVQVRYTPDTWLITVATPRHQNTRESAVSRIDVSTVDLMDPASSWPLSRYDELAVLSAETGEVYKGAISSLGLEQLNINGKTVDVTGWAWKSPQGNHEFWYDGEGILVRYRTRILGREVTGVLQDIPETRGDVFSVAPAEAAEIDAEEL